MAVRCPCLLIVLVSQRSRRTRKAACTPLEMSAAPYQFSVSSPRNWEILYLNSTRKSDPRERTGANTHAGLIPDAWHFAGCLLPYTLDQSSTTRSVLPPWHSRTECSRAPCKTLHLP